MEILDVEGEVRLDEEARKDDEDEDRVDDMNRMVDDKEFNLLLATVSRTRLFTVTMVDRRETRLN